MNPLMMMIQMAQRGRNPLGALQQMGAGAGRRRVQSASASASASVCVRHCAGLQRV